MKVIIEGNEPLVGIVQVSGSRNSALMLIPAALFSNEDIVIENTPRIGEVFSALELVKALGGEVEWLASNKLRLNASSISTFEIPLEFCKEVPTYALFAPALLYRFGKAVFPKPSAILIKSKPINRLVETWRTLGFEVKEEGDCLHVESRALQNTEVVFKNNTVTGTENAILSALFIPGETTISNCAVEPEVDDLINFVNSIGANVKRVEERKIIINGFSFLSGGRYTLMSDRVEAVFYAVCALMTDGDIKVEGAEPGDLLPFLRRLESMGATYEFTGKTLRVWKLKDSALKAVSIETGAAPAFISGWLPLTAVLLTRAHGTSIVYETMTAQGLGFVKELNRMGAKIELLKPSEAGLKLVLNDDSFDVSRLGEPYSTARIEGPVFLKREKIELDDKRVASAMIAAALSAEGKSEIGGFDIINSVFENVVEKLSALGAHIKVEN